MGRICTQLINTVLCRVGLIIGRLGWVVCLSCLGPTIKLGNEPHVLCNGPLVLGIGPHVLGNGPHSCTQLMTRDMLITGRLGWVVCLSWSYY